MYTDGRSVVIAKQHFLRGMRREGLPVPRNLLCWENLRMAVEYKGSRINSVAN